MVTASFNPLTLVLQMYTANTMASAAEALGMTLPGDSSFPAEYKEKLDECNSVGPALRNLVEKNILPRDIMTRAAFENAMVRIAYTIRDIPLSSFGHVCDYAIGVDDDPRRFHQRRAPSYRYRSFCRHQPHNRRFPIGIGPCSIHRGSQTEWEVCYGGRVQDWWNTRFVLYFSPAPFLGSSSLPSRWKLCSFFDIWFPGLSVFVPFVPEKSRFLFSLWLFEHFVLDPFH